MNDELRQMVIDTLRRGEELPMEWAWKLFPPERRETELVYFGKERKEDVLAETLAVPIQPVSAFGQANEAWHNKLIFGDNLQVMKMLLEMKQSNTLLNADGTAGVRLIYIDPPFGTKQEFRGSRDEKAYQDRVAGAEFIEFLRRRLILMRELLADNGAIYVHLDQRKSHAMKLVLDELFFEHRFVNEIVWRRLSAHNDADKYGPIHDTIFFYTKSENYVWNPQLGPVSDEYLDQFFDQVEEKSGRQYARGDLTARGLRNGETGKPWKGIDPSKKGNHWKVLPSELDRLEAAGKIHWPKKEGGMPRLKRFADEVNGVTLQDIWSDIKLMHNMSPERTGYPTQKPEALLDRIIKTSSNEGDIVLDAFAGSGTTCAVAEKLGRRWIGIDCGKLAIYTIQKRLLNLKADIGNKAKPMKARPFMLYTAGLYDFSSLKKLPWNDWRFFALQLFGCKDEPHEIGGMKLDGKLKGASVLVFDHFKHTGQRIDEETIQTIHDAIGKKISNKLFIIAPRGVFDFQQDYIPLDGVRYYALRIPYSVVSDLHRKQFSALQQPSSELAVNDTVDAVGFDFIQPPIVKYAVSKKGGQYLLSIKEFESRARIRGKDTRGGFETLSMVMLDLNYEGDTFVMDVVFFADELESNDWIVEIPALTIGGKIMVVFIDIYGNEAREVVEASEVGKGAAISLTAQKVKTSVKAAKKGRK